VKNRRTHTGRARLRVEYVALAGLTALVSLAGCNSKVQFQGASADKLNPKVVNDQEFPAATIADAAVHFKPAYGLVEETLTLKQKDPLTTTIKQAERKQLEDPFKQGHEAQQNEQMFDISAAGKLDLLVVVDNSASMANNQANLADKLKDLTASLTRVDWQVGVITSDMIKTDTANGDDMGNRPPGCLLRNGGKPIKKGDATAADDFYTAVNVGTDGSGNERLIRNTLLALNGSCPKGDNKWLRADASLGILMITDEDSTCPGDGDSDSLGTCGPGERPSDLIDYVKNRWPNRAKVYSLSWQSPKVDTSCRYIDSQHQALRILSLENSTTGIGGFDKSICQDSFSAELQGISQDVSRIVQREVTLAYDPVIPTIKLVARRVGETDFTPLTDFTVTGKTIKITAADADQIEQVKVDYGHDATPKFDHVQMSGKPAPGTIKVFVNGAALDPGQYTYDDLTGEIMFAAMPPDDADVKIRYRQVGDLPHEFDVGSLKVDGDLVGVTVNGQAVTGTTYDAKAGTLSFATPPDDGAAIAVSYREPDNRITHYAVSSQNLAALQGLSVKDADTGQPLGAALDGSEIVFDEADVVEGRHALVTYDYGDKDTVLSHELANPPLPDTLTVKEDGQDPGCITNTDIEGQTVSFNCTADQIGDVTIAYKYVAERYTTFTLNSDVPPGAFVHVYVDGIDEPNYKLDGRVVTVPDKDLQLDSKVRVIVTVIENDKKK